MKIRRTVEHIELKGALDWSGPNILLAATNQPGAMKIRRTLELRASVD